MKGILKFILERGTEKSTILTILTMAGGAIGLSLSPEQSDVVAAAVVSILAAVGVFTEEK